MVLQKHRAGVFGFVFQNAPRCEDEVAVVDQHRGDLSVDSQAGKTRFVAKLPIMKAAIDAIDSSSDAR